MMLSNDGVTSGSDPAGPRENHRRAWMGIGWGRLASAWVAGTLMILSGHALRVPMVQAYEADTTHAGLTQRSAQASSLAVILNRRLGLQRGLWEDISAELGQPGANDGGAFLWRRLRRVGAAHGGRPKFTEVDGQRRAECSALGWLIAGAVIAESPAERGHHLYFDPSDGLGLQDESGLGGAT